MEERINNPAARLYRSMYLIRRVEEEIVRLYPTDKIKSPVHLSIGQEAVSAAVWDHLSKRDYVFGTYRGHALYLAKGGDVPRMMAELYGKVDGCAHGKAGSMHLVDPEVGMMGPSAVVATGISDAVGAALALRMKRSPAIVACFFGEGAVDEGAFHESINFASLKKLPILFVCENNFYAIYSHVKDRLAGPGLCARARAYGVEAELIEDGDPLALHARVGVAIDAVRRGQGPRFLECMTYRWRDHVGPTEDRQHQYRPDAELDQNMAAKMSYMFSGAHHVPLVVRAIIGRSWGQGAQHSQAFHSYFMHIPGLRVVAPTTPHDAKGCLISAIRDDNPVIMIEHRMLHNVKGVVPETSYEVPYGRARTLSPGKDITIVGISHMALECVRAKHLLLEAGIDAEVIDPVSLSPLDGEGIARSVERTGRLLVVDTGWLSCGASSEILAEVFEKIGHKRPFLGRRMGYLPTPCPTTKVLENLYYPSAQSIAATAYRLVRGDDAAAWQPATADSREVVEFRGPF